MSRALVQYFVAPKEDMSDHWIFVLMDENKTRL